MPRTRKKRRQKAKTTEQILHISELGWHGDGIAEADGKRVFVPFTLAGETVRAKVRGTRGRLVEILEAAPDRVEPTCPHFSTCGGCAVQHLKTGLYGEWKQKIIEKALANRGIEASVAPLIDAHGEGRRRVTFHARFAGTEVEVGFMKVHSHRLVDLDRCPILVPELDNATSIARDLVTPLAKTPKPLDIQLTATETGLDCVIRGAGEMDLDSRTGLSQCADKHDLARVTVDEDMIVERRPPMLTFGAGKVTLPPGGFLQATKAGENALADLVLDAVAGAKKVADLYCGVGPFSLRMAATSSVLAVDSDEAAINALKSAAHHTQGQKPVTAEVRDLLHSPLHAKDLKGFDAVIFDPPRAGAERQAREIAATGVKTVVAVSCNPATFSHDAAILVDGGYRLEKVTPVDQFRYTGHIELVGVFVRPDRRSN